MSYYWRKVICSKCGKEDIRARGACRMDLCGDCYQDYLWTLPRSPIPMYITRGRDMSKRGNR